MSVIVGTQTNIGRERQAKSFISGLAGYPALSISYFKIGQGGWMLDNGFKVPKTPNPALEDIEATGGTDDTYFQKALTADKVEFVAPTTSKITCTLDLLEGNDNGLGESPTYFEIGLFDSTGKMVIYATFPEETKNATKILTHVILAVW